MKKMLTIICLLVGMLMVQGCSSEFLAKMEANQRAWQIKCYGRPHSEIPWRNYKNNAKSNQARRWTYIENNRAILTNEMINIITNGEIQKGMTKDQTTASCGRPDRVHHTTGSWGSRDQWVYGGRCWRLYPNILGDGIPKLVYVSPHYVYFEYGKLTGWQN